MAKSKNVKTLQILVTNMVASAVVSTLAGAVVGGATGSQGYGVVAAAVAGFTTQFFVTRAQV